MPNETPTKDIITRKVPKEIHLKARQRALADGLSVNTIVIALLSYYAANGLPQQASPKP